MNIIIVGYGRLGKEISKQNTNHNIIGIKRKKDESLLNIEQVNVDITNTKKMHALDIDAADVLIYSITPGERTKEAYENAYKVGLKNILNSSMFNPKKTLVIFISSTSVYGNVHNIVVNEESATLPQHFNGQVLLEAEEYLKYKTPLHYIMRFAGIYDSFSFRLLKEAHSLNIHNISSNYFYTNRIHLEDCARMIWHVIYTQIPYGIYIGVDNESEVKAHVLNWIRIKLGLPKIPIDMSNTIIKNKRCSNQKITKNNNIEDLFNFQYPSYKEGYLDVINKYKSLLLPFK